MDIYFCERPDSIEQLRAIERRLPPQHLASLVAKKQLVRELAGIKGQNAIRFPLNFIHGLEPPVIIHNLCLEDEYGLFEIDTLLICPRFILLNEVKNWYGTLLVDNENQVVRVGDNEAEEGMANPFSQVKVQRFRLQKWLERQNFSMAAEMPLLYQIVISFSSTIIKPLFPANELPDNLLHSNQLPWKLQQLYERHAHSHLTTENISIMSRQLLAQHKVRQSNIMEALSVTGEDLIKGVFCPACASVPMAKGKAGWNCSECGHVSQHAHEAALRDYQLLFGNSITNKRARAFLRLDSPYAAKRILQKTTAYAAGEKSTRIYYLIALPYEE